MSKKKFTDTFLKCCNTVEYWAEKESPHYFHRPTYNDTGNSAASGRLSRITASLAGFIGGFGVYQKFRRR